MLSPNFFMGGDLSKLSFETRLLFEGLWLLADRSGRLEDHPMKIKAQVFPYDDVDVDKMLDALADERPYSGGCFILRFSANGHKHIHICNFGRHQRPHPKEPPSEIPSPVDAQPGKNTARPAVKRNGEARPDPSESLTESESGSSGSSESESESKTLWAEDARASLVPAIPVEVRKALWMNKRLVICEEWLKAELQKFYQETAWISPETAGIVLTQADYGRAFANLAKMLVIHQEQRAVPTSSPAKKRGFATRVLRHFQLAVLDKRVKRYPSYAERVDRSVAAKLTSRREREPKALKTPGEVLLSKWANKGLDDGG